jgi:hypothetical protein
MPGKFSVIQLQTKNNILKLIYMNKLLIIPLSVMLFAIAVMQSGCNDDSENNQYPDVTASADTIYGILKYKQVDTAGKKLLDWNYGPGMIRVVIGDETVYTTALQSDGNFMVILPATVSGNNFTPLSDIAVNYGGTIKVTPETARYFKSTEFIVDYTDHGTAKNMTISQAVLNSNLSAYRNYYYYFYENEGSVLGTGTAGNIFNWTFTKGWGMVESEMSTGATYIIRSKSVNAAPVNAVWTN